MVGVRRASPADLQTITEIYNEAILNTTATLDTRPKSAREQQEWFEAHGPQNPILVAEREGVVVGWASLSTWSDRCGYSDTAEISVYVAAGQRGKGIGRTLIESIVEEGRKVGLHVLIARIGEGNEASVALHRSIGFEPVGVMKEVGRKFGKFLDVYVMELIYLDPPPGGACGRSEGCAP